MVRLAEDWVAAITMADDAAYVRFVQERGPELRDEPEQWLELRDMIRGIRLCGVKSVSTDMVELWSFDAIMDSYVTMNLVPAKGAADRVALSSIMFADEAPPGAVFPTPATLGKDVICARPLTPCPSVARPRAADTRPLVTSSASHAH